MITSLSVVLLLVPLALSAPNGNEIILQGPSSKTTLIGPDGSHITGIAPGGVVTASLPHSGGIGLVGGPVLGLHGVLEGQPLLGVGSGHEGQWVPDYTEQLFDDGSYKGDHYDH